MRNLTFSLIVLLISCSNDPNATNDNALSAYRSEQYELSSRLWHKVEQQTPNQISEYWLGVLYQEGKGVELDSREASQWYKKASEKGLANATVQYGILTANGFSVPFDATLLGDDLDMSTIKHIKQAHDLYLKAAQQGNELGQYKLAELYENGRYGIEQDFSTALMWYRKAADQGDADALYKLGYFYENGTGVNKSYEQARLWYRKSATKGGAKKNAEGKAHMMCFLIQKCTLEKTFEAVDAVYHMGYEKDARKMWQDLANDSNDVPSQYRLGLMNEKGEKPLRYSDADMAAKWYGKAADSGHADSQFRLAFMYEQGYGVIQNIEKAKLLYQKSANQGHSAALKKIKLK